MYTLKRLKELNVSLGKQGISDKDVEIANSRLAILDQLVLTSSPCPGDTIICRGEDNVEYHSGIINELDGNDVRICVKPMVPHITKSGVLSTSGGYWFRCGINEIKRSPTLFAERMFWTWDSYGPRKDGGVHFNAKVKVWEVFSSKVY